MPPYLESSSPIPRPISAPPLDALPAQGLQCVYCDFGKIMVTSDFQGPADVQLKLHIGQNGLVEQAEVAHTTNREIDETVAALARSWNLVPRVKDGVAHSANTDVKLRIQAIKN